jgi:DNA mismatch repair ATPase MutL
VKRKAMPIMEAQLKTLTHAEIGKLNASQVITSLTNVVKELLENALDAGANRVGKQFSHSSVS